MKPQKELTDAEYQSKYIDNQPKNPANKKYGFCEPLIANDRIWKLHIIKKHNEESKKLNEKLSLKFATPFQLKYRDSHKIKNNID